MNLEEFRNKYLHNKTYLGDGLYVHHDGGGFVLSTERENGEHWVGLEEAVLQNLLTYREQFYRDYESRKEK